MPFVQQRRGTYAQLTAANEIPLDGQLIIEEQGDGFQKLKVGDGVTPYNALGYVTQSLDDLADVDTFTSPVVPDGRTLVRNNGGNFTETYVPYAAVGSLPLGNYPTGSLGEKIDSKIDTTDARLSDERVPTDNSVSTAKLQDGAVDHNKLMNGAVGSDQLAGLAVTTVKIQTSAVTESRIADDAVTSAKIATDAVGSVQIAAGAVGNAQLAAGSVISSKIDDDAVTFAKMQDVSANSLLGAVNAGEVTQIVCRQIGRDILDDSTAADVRTTISAVHQSDIDAAIANLIDSAPGALDTLNELAAALGDDANFSTTVTNSIATNTSNISTNTGNIATNTSNIATNASDISTNTSNINANTGNIAANTANITTNTSNISTNTTSASNAATTANSAVAAAATNQGNITTNTSNIATNTSDIATNTSSIATNTSNISTNTSNIATNTSGIATNVTNIAAKLPLAGGTMTGTLLVKSGYTSAPGLSFSTDTDTGFNASGDKIHVICGGTRQIYIEDDQCQFHQAILADERITTKKGIIAGNNSVDGFDTLVLDNYNFMSRAYLATDNNDTFCFHARMQDAIASGGHTSTGEWVAFNAELAYDGGGTRAKHIGFKANDSLKGIGTLTAGFYSDMSDASVWQLYMVGTAPSLFGGQVQIKDGTSSAPGIAFSADTNTGMFRSTSTGLNLVWNGSGIQIASAYILNEKQLRIPDGSASNPAIAFTNDSNTGLSYTSNNFNLVYGGANRISIGNGGVTIGNVTTTLNGAVAITQGLPLSEIAQGGATSGQTLQWNGSTWSPTTPSGGGGGASSLNGLNDVTITGTPSDNSLLRYDSGNSVFENYNPDSFSSSSGGSVAINLADANKIHKWTCASSGVQSVVLLNIPSTSGVSCSFTLVIEYPGSGTTTAIVQWPSSFKWPGGVAPTLTNTGGKQDTFTFLSLDNGSTWLAHVGGQNF